MTVRRISKRELQKAQRVIESAAAVPVAEVAAAPEPMPEPVEAPKKKTKKAKKKKSK